MTDWIREPASKGEPLLPVCIGALLLLAMAGLLDDLEATTHHRAIHLLRQTAPWTRRTPKHEKVISQSGIARIPFFSDNHFNN